MFVELLANTEPGNRTDAPYWEKSTASWEIIRKSSEFTHLTEVAEKEMVLILDAITYTINHRVKFQGYSVLHDQPLRSPAPENWALVLKI